VLHEHHLIIRVGAGLIQFVYGSHSRMAADLTLDKIYFRCHFRGVFRDYVSLNNIACIAMLQHVVLHMLQCCSMLYCVYLHAHVADKYEQFKIRKQH